MKTFLNLWNLLILIFYSHKMVWVKRTKATFFYNINIFLIQTYVLTFTQYKKLYSDPPARGFTIELLWLGDGRLSFVFPVDTGEMCTFCLHYSCFRTLRVNHCTVTYSFFSQRIVTYYCNNHILTGEMILIKFNQHK